MSGAGIGNHIRRAASLGDRRSRLGDGGRIRVGRKHARALDCKQLRAGAADATARAGYDRTLAGESTCTCWRSGDRLTEQARAAH